MTAVVFRMALALGIVGSAIGVLVNLVALGRTLAGRWRGRLPVQRLAEAERPRSDRRGPPVRGE